jgi:hypothetical protein
VKEAAESEIRETELTNLAFPGNPSSARSTTRRSTKMSSKRRLIFFSSLREIKLISLGYGERPKVGKMPLHDIFLISPAF